MLFTIVLSVTISFIATAICVYLLTAYRFRSTHNHALPELNKYKKMHQAKILEVDKWRKAFSQVTDDRNRLAKLLSRRVVPEKLVPRVHQQRVLCSEYRDKPPCNIDALSKELLEVFGNNEDAQVVLDLTVDVSDTSWEHRTNWTYTKQCNNHSSVTYPVSVRTESFRGPLGRVMKEMHAFLTHNNTQLCENDVWRFKDNVLFKIDVYKVVVGDYPEVIEVPVVETITEIMRIEKPVFVHTTIDELSTEDMRTLLELKTAAQS